MSSNSYINWNSMSDIAISDLIGSFIKHHRLDQNLTQGEVSKAAGISRSTLSLLERGQKVNLSSLIQVLRVLDKLSVLEDFKVQRLISPMLLAEMDQKKRYRARSKKPQRGSSDLETQESDW